MAQEMLRLLIAVLASVLLANQARQAAGLWRRRGFALGALGFGLLSGVNVLVLLGLGEDWLRTAGIGLTLACVAVAIGCLFMGYRAGEMKEQFRQVREKTAAEREKKLEERPRQKR